MRDLGGQRIVAPVTQEGVVQFRYELTTGSPPADSEVRDLVRWRRELFGRDVIGCDLGRYGACYGNMSARTGTWAAPPGRREFLVSGTQTGGDPVGGRELLVRVVRYDHARNLVVAQGPCAPSSETMTHGAIYDASLAVRAVVHGHDPALWRWLLAQGAPRTAETVAYGTPAMAEAARSLVEADRRHPWRLAGIFAMAGHEDGVVAFGASVAQATERFIAAWGESR